MELARTKRFFLPTFSGATEKVGLRSSGCGVTAFNGTPVNPDKRADRVVGPYRVRRRIGRGAAKKSRAAARNIETG